MANVKISTTNTTQGYQQPVNPNADGVVANGFYPQNSSSNDANAGIERGASNELNLKAGGAAVVAVASASTSPVALVRIANASTSTPSMQIDAPTNDVQGLLINGYSGAGNSALVITGASATGTPAANIRNFDDGPALRVYAEGSDAALLVVANGTGEAINATGTVQATTFSGSGSLLTSIPNSATTAASTNTASAIVARDASGNFSAGTITASLNGNATTATSATSATSATNATNAVNATKLLTSAVTTNATYYPAFSLSASTASNDLRIASSLNFNPSTGVLAATTFSGSGASLTSIPNSATTATSANTASAIIARDASGNFSAGAITATGATVTGGSASADNVVISASTTGAALRVTQTGAGESLRVEDSANPDASPFIVDAAGQVGIGITPAVQLHVAGNTNTWARLQAAAAIPLFGAFRSNGTNASPTAVVANDEMGRFDVRGYNNADFRQGGSIQAFCASTPGASDTAIATNLIFNTSPGGTTAPFARMTLDSAGNLGVGTQATFGNAQLNVNAGIVARTVAASGTTPYIQTYNGNATTDLKTWRIGGNSSGSLVVETVNDAYTAATNRATLTNAGVFTVAGQIESSSTGYKFPDATTQTTSAGTISRLTSAVTTTSTTFTDITGLTATVAALTPYFFEAYLIWQQNNTAGGIGFAVNGPSTPGVLDYTIQYQNFANDAAGTIQTVHATGYDSGYTIPTTTTAANTSYIARISGVIVPGVTAGTLALRFKSNNASYTASIRSGSWLAIRRGNT